MNPDDEYLKSLRNLDSRTLADIHNRYFSKLFSYFFYRTQDGQVSEDLSSEVFVRLLESLKNKKSAISNFEGWLFGVAAHLVNDHLRTKYRFNLESFDDQYHRPSPDHTESQVDQILAMRQFRRAYLALTSDQQHVLALRFSQQLSIDDTARIMDKPVNTVKVLQHRALVALRKKMK